MIVIKIDGKEVELTDECLERCLSKKKAAGIPIDKQALAICMSECGMEKKLQHDIEVIPMILPTSDNRKFSKAYAQFIESTPLLKRKCGDCMHFISDSQTCQIVDEGNKGIQAADGCRLQRDNYELEGIKIVSSNSDSGNDDSIKIIDDNFNNMDEQDINNRDVNSDE